MANTSALVHPPFVGDDGVWCQQVRAISGGLRPALFLDRDGVIVEEVHYLHRIEDMRLTINAAVVIRAANTLGLPVILVTNQSGVGRGNYGWSDFESVQIAMLDALVIQNAFIDAVFACLRKTRDCATAVGYSDDISTSKNQSVLMQMSVLLNRQTHVP